MRELIGRLRVAADLGAFQHRRQTNVAEYWEQIK